MLQAGRTCYNFWWSFSRLKESIRTLNTLIISRCLAHGTRWITLSTLIYHKVFIGWAFSTLNSINQFMEIITNIAFNSWSTRITISYGVWTVWTNWPVNVLSIQTFRAIFSILPSISMLTLKAHSRLCAIVQTIIYLANTGVIASQWLIMDGITWRARKRSLCRARNTTGMTFLTCDMTKISVIADCNFVTWFVCFHNTLFFRLINLFALRCINT